MRKTMLDGITNSSVINILGRGLQAANLRHEVISNNVANVNTPNFKKSDVVFEDLLAKELSTDSNTLKMTRTHDNHLPVSVSPELVSPSVQQDSTTTMRTDNNNVDIDIEMATLAKNNIYYNSMAREVGAYLTKIKSVIKG